MILLQAYLYTYSLLRGVTFEVLPSSSYALSPMIPSLLETLKMSKRNVMMAEEFTGPKFRTFPAHRFMLPLQYFHMKSLVDSLALGNEFKVNNSSYQRKS